VKTKGFGFPAVGLVDSLMFLTILASLLCRPHSLPFSLVCVGRRTSSGCQAKQTRARRPPTDVASGSTTNVLSIHSFRCCRRPRETHDQRNTRVTTTICALRRNCAPLSRKQWTVSSITVHVAEQIHPSCFLVQRNNNRRKKWRNKWRRPPKEQNRSKGPFQNEGNYDWPTEYLQYMYH